MKPSASSQYTTPVASPLHHNITHHQYYTIQILFDVMARYKCYLLASLSYLLLVVEVVWTKMLGKTLH